MGLLDFPPRSDQSTVNAADRDDEARPLGILGLAHAPRPDADQPKAAAEPTHQRPPYEERESFRDLSDADFVELATQPGVEIVEHAKRTDPLGMIRHDFTLARRWDAPRRRLADLLGDDALAGLMNGNTAWQHYASTLTPETRH